VIKLKRIIALIAVFILLFSLTVSADSSINITPDGEFITETEQIAKIIGMDKNELLDFCIENKIVYIAVNKDNSKQIRVTVKENDFSNGIVNINGLSDDKINAVLPDVIGVEGIKGEIINKDGQKFIKTEMSSKDSGGDFILTEYITVANKKVYVLSFYTNKKADTKYIEKTFETLESPNFVVENNGLFWVVGIAIVIFLFATVFIIITLIRDIKAKKAD
jgi:hypothetical protein